MESSSPDLNGWDAPRKARLFKTRAETNRRQPEEEMHRRLAQTLSLPRPDVREDGRTWQEREEIRPWQSRPDLREEAKSRQGRPESREEGRMRQGRPEPWEQQKRQARSNSREEQRRLARPDSREEGARHGRRSVGDGAGEPSNPSLNITRDQG